MEALFAHVVSKERERGKGPQLCTAQKMERKEVVSGVCVRAMSRRFYVLSVNTHSHTYIYPYNRHYVQTLRPYLNEPEVAREDHNALKRGTSSVGTASFFSSAIFRAVSAASNSSSRSRSCRNLMRVRVRVGGGERGEKGGEG